MIYLDAAATTFQKPDTVPKAVCRAMYYMTTPGRGGYAPAELAADTVFRCREAAADFFNAPGEESVVFTMNATHGLNIAIHTLVHPGDHVLVSGYEHNAVLRPLYAMDRVSVHIARGQLFSRESLLREFEKNLTADISCVICTQVSNVFGFILPVKEISLLCKRQQVPFVIDASQSAGILPVDLKESGAAFIAMPGHKGLYGPQGTGILLCARDAEPLIFGGTGSLSAEHSMPEFLPERLEAGTQNICGIAGLLEGLRFVKKTGIDRISAHEKRLISFLAEGLEGMQGVKIFCAGDSACQSGVLSFLMEGEDCETAANYFAHRGIAVRAGLHCAPCAHETADTLSSGTVRLSVSAFNTIQEMQKFLSVLKDFLSRKEA